MNKNLLIVVFLVIIVGLSGYIYKLRTTPDTEPTTTSQNTNNATPTPTTMQYQPININTIGVLRTSGLSQSEKKTLGLSYSSYLVTNLTAPLTIQGVRFERILLELKDQDYQRFLGKCVEIKANIPEELISFITTTDYVNGQYTYKSIPVVPTSINKVDYTNCHPYGTTTSTENSTTLDFSGVVERFERAAPDIYYDYQITLDSPYKDDQNASGLSISQKQLIIVPNTDDVWTKMEETIGSHVKIKGYMTWGYSESRYLVVKEISPK